MFSVITCIRDDHDWRLVLAAAAVCLIGAMAAMLPRCRTTSRELVPSPRSSWRGKVESRDGSAGPDHLHMTASSTGGTG